MELLIMYALANVLRRANVNGIAGTLRGHSLNDMDIVSPMAEQRVAKRIFYSILEKIKRKHSGQLPRYKDVLRSHMKKSSIVSL